MKKLIFKFKYFFFKPVVFKQQKFLLETAKNNEIIIKENSFVNFKMLVKHAYENSPYYFKKYTTYGIKPDDLYSYEDIIKIPIITRQEIKDNLLEILTVSLSNRKISKGSTGGSTGTPMAYYSDKSLPLEAFAWRYLSWWDLNPWDNGAFIWRKVRKGFLKETINKIAWWPVKKLKLDATILNDEIFESFTRKFNKAKPKLLQGYIGAIHQYALYIEKSKIKVHSPKAIWVTSAPIAKNQREIIEKVFNAPLYNEYGSSEIPWIAAQCSERKALHINSEGRYVEIVSPDKDGVGDIVITDLLNYSFPLIRYEIGDRSKFIHEKCGCGCNLPLLDEVKGRVGDTFVIPEVGKLDGSFLTTIFDDYPFSIKAFQLIQHADLSITLRVVPNTNYENWNIEVGRVLSLLQKRVCDKVNISLDTTSEIGSDRGKTRFIIKEY